MVPALRECGTVPCPSPKFFKPLSVRRSSQIVKLVLLVSCAHALVHVIEQSVASVELVISKEFRFEDLRQSGLLGLAIRLPYGLGAFFAGLLADRFGEKRILVLFLFGSAFVTGALSQANSLNLVYAEVFTLGCFASMYHPAGLALLANQTTSSERSRALGLHGVFGSIGIATAPFIAGFMLTVRPGDWRAYYLLLGGVSCVLAILVWRLLRPAVPSEPPSSSTVENSSGRWSTGASSRGARRRRSVFSPRRGSA